jgi:hypothetical protein
MYIFEGKRVNLDRKTCHSVKGLANRRALGMHKAIQACHAHWQGARMQRNGQEVIAKMTVEARAGGAAIQAYEVTFREVYY